MAGKHLETTFPSSASHFLKTDTQKLKFCNVIVNSLDNQEYIYSLKEFWNPWVNGFKSGLRNIQKIVLKLTNLPTQNTSAVQSSLKMVKINPCLCMWSTMAFQNSVFNFPFSKSGKLKTETLFPDVFLPFSSCSALSFNLEVVISSAS